MAVKYLQNVVSDNVELNRVQNNVAEALRHLENNIALNMAKSSCCSGAKPGVIPKGFELIFQFSGSNAANALRHLNLGIGGGACQVGETRIAVPFSGRVQTLIIQMDTPYPFGGIPANETRFTVRKNGVGNNALQDTTLEVDLNASDVGILFDIDDVHWFDVVRGDYIGVTYNEVSMNGAMSSYVNATLMLVAT